MNEFKGKDERELRKLLTDKREALAALRFKAAGGKTKNAREAKPVRKDIARILTELNAK